MKLLGLCGSLRRQSTNLALLEAFGRHAPAGIAVVVASEIGELPLFNPDREGDATPAPVLAFARRVDEAEGLIVACPEYAHGIPGALKNALDWLVSRFEIPGKPVMLVHASTRGQFVREHLSEVLRTMSVRLYDGPHFETHLIGRAHGETRRLLDGGDMPGRIGDALLAFGAFAATKA